MPDTSHPTRFDTATFFSQSLKDRDQDVFAAIEKEQTRQQKQIELIASENIVSRAVLDALAAVLVGARHLADICP